MRFLSEFFIPMLVGGFTAIIIATTAAVTFLLAMNTWGLHIAALAVALYATTLVGLFVWVMSRYERPRGGRLRKTCDDTARV